MFDNPIYNYSIASILKSLGCREQKKNMFFSPLRNESVASLHVDPEKNLWYDHCKEVLTFNKEQGKEYRLIGFENNAGGYAMKAVSGFKSTNRSGITTINTDGERNINPSSESVAIFEGFFDFMSWLVFQNTEKPSCDVVVLNSVNNLEKAIDYVNRHSSILCFTDRDEAGRRCLDRISGLFKGKQIMDMSNLYKKYKDLNEMLVASRGYNKNMSIKH